MKKHEHEYKKGRGNVDVCYCGRFRFNEKAGPSIITQTKKTQIDALKTCNVCDASLSETNKAGYCNECLKGTARHTSGPWEVRQSSNPKNGTNWRDIVSLYGQFSPSYVGEALEKDAHLIAAAPELLEMLYAVLPCVEESDEFNKPSRKLAPLVRKLIAKAEGRE